MDNGTGQTLVCMPAVVSNMSGWVWIGCSGFYTQLIDKRHVPRDEDSIIWLKWLNSACTAVKHVETRGKIEIFKSTIVTMNAIITNHHKPKRRGETKRHVAHVIASRCEEQLQALRKRQVPHGLIATFTCKKHLPCRLAPGKPLPQKTLVSTYYTSCLAAIHVKHNWHHMLSTFRLIDSYSAAWEQSRKIDGFCPSGCVWRCG